jgi:hypothetical protein
VGHDNQTHHDILLKSFNKRALVQSLDMFAFKLKFSLAFSAPGIILFAVWLFGFWCCYIVE